VTDAQKLTSLLKIQACPKWANRPVQMGGHRERCGSLFFDVSIKDWIPVSHLLLRIHKLADQTL
jgi:hypothetical protein